MPGSQLTSVVESDPEAVRVIDNYLRQLAARMPAHTPLTPDMVDEMREDLVLATAALVSRSTGPVAAAEAAVRDFGDHDDIAGALRPELAARHARRAGVSLMATGPIVGLTWLAAIFLGAGHVEVARWLLVLVAPVVVIGAAATGLTVLATGQFSRRLRPSSELARKASGVARAAACIGDLLLLAGCAVLWPRLNDHWSMLFAVAAGASAVRLAIIARTARRVFLPAHGPHSSRIA